MKRNPCRLFPILLLPQYKPSLALQFLQPREMKEPTWSGYRIYASQFIPNEEGSQDLQYQFEIGNKLLPTTALMTTESDSVKTMAKEFQFWEPSSASVKRNRQKPHPP